ncbi:hypothetical protein C8R45DRAFT_972566 [Mycena sanguinolenta]|nr:hypothetical protein C8R45DRAFT_972566 [Mycena sanguinolenta]
MPFVQNRVVRVGWEIIRVHQVTPLAHQVGIVTVSLLRARLLQRKLEVRQGPMVRLRKGVLFQFPQLQNILGACRHDIREESPISISLKRAAADDRNEGPESADKVRQLEDLDCRVSLEEPLSRLGRLQQAEYAKSVRGGFESRGLGFGSSDDRRRISKLGHSSFLPDVDGWLLQQPEHDRLQLIDGFRILHKQTNGAGGQTLDVQRSRAIAFLMAARKKKRVEEDTA